MHSQICVHRTAVALTKYRFEIQTIVLLILQRDDSSRHSKIAEK
jgi:hypothetical protein